jgi:hypothetical protein
MTLLEPLLTSLHGLPPHATARVRLAADEPGRPGDGHRLLPVRVGADGPNHVPGASMSAARPSSTRAIPNE